jgi:predicted Rossmann-fold nucleotide-binding protein
MKVLNKIRLFIIIRLLRKEEQTMAVIYATLIVEGTINPKTNEAYKFSDVPKVIQPKVKDVLDALGLPDLAE